MKKFILLLILFSFVKAMNAQDTPLPFPKDTVVKSNEIKSIPTINYFDTCHLLITGPPALHSFEDFKINLFCAAKNILLIDGSFNFASSAINNSFGSKFYFQNDITDEDKDGVSKKLKSKNIAGLNTKVGLTYYHAPVRIKYLGNVAYFFRFNNRQWLDAQFTNDAFELVFRGNAMFAGKTAIISNSHFMQLSYNQYQAGLIRWFRDKKNNGYEMKLGVSLLQGNQYNAANASVGEVFTQEDGQYIDVKYKFNVDRADTSNTSTFMHWNGTGASFDLNFRMHTAKKGWIFNIGIEDAGAIRFNNNVVRYTADSSIHFGGLVIQDFLHNTTQAANTGNIDSLYTVLLPHKSASPFTVKLPFVLKASVSKMMGKSKYTLGVMNQFYSSAMPLVYVNDRIQFKQLFIQPQVSYGGYGRLHVGFGVGMSIRYKFYWLLSTEDLQAINFKNTGGLSAAVKMGFAF